MKPWMDLGLWILSISALVVSAVIASFVYGLADDWQGNIPGALFPFSVGATAFALALGPLIYAWGKVYRLCQELDPQ